MTSANKHRNFSSSAAMTIANDQNDLEPLPLNFPKQRRVVRGDDFTKAIRGGTVAADGTLVVFVTPSIDNAMPKMGVTIAKRTGNAVVRNQWKRWIRESFRTQQHDLPRGFDIVIRPKKDAAGSWSAIKRSLPKLVNKAVSRYANNH